MVKHGYSLLSGCFALHNLQIANLVELLFFAITNYITWSILATYHMLSISHILITLHFYRCNWRWRKRFWPMQRFQKMELITESTYQIITYYHFNGLANNCFSFGILAERTKDWSRVFFIVRDLGFPFHQGWKFCMKELIHLNAWFERFKSFSTFQN